MIQGSYSHAIHSTHSVRPSTVLSMYSTYISSFSPAYQTNGPRLHEDDTPPPLPSPLGGGASTTKL